MKYPNAVRRFKHRAKSILWKWLVRDRPTGRAQRLARELRQTRDQLLILRKLDCDRQLTIRRLEGELSFVTKYHYASQGVRHG